MSERCDVAIVGGGAIGSSIAYWLAADPDFDGSVVVVERDPSYADSSTTRSAGSIRQQFSTPENIAMSLFGADFLRRMGELLAVDGEEPDPGFVEGGYLFLGTEATRDILEANYDTQSRMGASVALLDPDALAIKFPWLRTEGIALGSFGYANEGWFDPWALLQAFRRKARSLGVAYREDRVVGLDVEAGRVTGLRLASGETLACGAAVNAAGPRAAELAAMAGIDLPVRPRKRVVHVFDCRTEVPGCPLIVNPNGVYVRPESGQFICGVGPPEDRDPDTLDLDPDYTLFDEIVWPTLAERIPAFEAIKPVRAWAGHYAVNIFDHNALLGLHPASPNLYFANGFSGHGLQQAPAVGRAIAELIVHDRYVALDLSRFGVERIVTGAAVHEINVV